MKNLKTFHVPLNFKSDVSKRALSIVALLLMPFLVNSQTIEKFSIDSGGISKIAGNFQVLYTIGEVNVQELSTAMMNVSEGFINADFEVKLNPKLFLQGPLLAPTTAGLMNDNLRTLGLIPTTSPYPDAATANASVFAITGNNAIVDWVWVEVRASNDNVRLINGKSAFVQRDGDVVGLDGVSDLYMHASPTNYYLVVKHRNHLGAMTAAVVALKNNATTVVDFTSKDLNTFGSNARVQMGSSVRALWAGDANDNGIIQYAGGTPDPSTILSVVLNSPTNTLKLPSFPFNGYLSTDIDLNGQTQYVGGAPDTPLILQNVLANPSNNLKLATFPIEEQVPATLGRAMKDRAEFETKRINNTDN